MPQELHVLQCWSCSTFQVHIVKKVPKWCCKICNEKQSVKKVFGKGTGKECRLLVQKLNENNLNPDDMTSRKVDENYDCNNFLQAANSSNDVCQNVPSKWLEFTEDTQEDTQTREGNRPEGVEKSLEATTTVIESIFESDPKDLDSILDCNL